MRTQTDLTCETRDGIELAADVYLPDEEGEYPALLAYSPYGKNIQDSVRFLPKQSREQSTMWDGTIEAGDIRYITDNEYAHVIADVRGTGDSGGQTVGFFDKAGQDGYDLVEWIADQPWCDGQVGGVGRSWFGTNQLLLAAANPPSLVGVFPSGVFTDLYREFAYHGGILNMFLYGLWDGRHGDSGIVDNDWVSRERHVDVEAFERQLEEALKRPEIKQYPNLYQLLHYPEKNPLFVDLVLNDTDGEFYAERSPHERLEDAECPIYISGAWGGTHTQPVYTAHEQLDVDHERILMTPPRLLERPYHEYKEEMLKWYDMLMKGQDTGLEEEPAVKMYVQGADRWRFEEQLVPERTEYIELFLRNHDRLLPDPETVADVPPRTFSQDPPNVSDELDQIRYATRPLSESREFTGPASLTLYASIDATDTTWMAYLYAVSPSGEREVLSRGYLRASHRAVDEEQSTPAQPYHPHVDPDPVTPGKVYEYRIGFPPIAILLEKSHRLELELRSMEIPFSETNELPPGSHHLPQSEPVTHRVYADRDHRSRLLLPEIPETDEEQWIDPDDPAHPGPVL
jgi:putative CocE/NonD family hydrolase